jgi:formate dehydrogenase subunit delta
MKPDDMVRMANQIATFFASYPHDEAVDGVTVHIRDYWEPRMKRQLAHHIQAGGDGLQPVVLEAAAKLALAA